jgi:glycogen debranching enzyme
MTWLLSWALQRTGEPAAAAQLREATLEQLAEGEFAEYYEPFSGEPLGARHQSWTAAAVLDWLCG